MMIFLFEFRNCSKSLPLLWMQEKLLQVWLSLLRCDWHIWWGHTCSAVHMWRSVGNTAESSAPLPPSLGLQVRLRLLGSDKPSPTFLLETGFLSEPGVVCLGNAGEPVLGCAWQCWSYGMLFYGCWDPGSGSHACTVSASLLNHAASPSYILFWYGFPISLGKAHQYVPVLEVFQSHPGMCWEYSVCLVGFSGILVGLWYCASLPGPACLL